MRPVVDEGLCIGCGNCEQICPSVFQVIDDISKVVDPEGCDMQDCCEAAEGKAIGEGSMRDFRLLSSVVSDLKGGVYINLGSAVVLPEVFLKAVAVTRNLKKPVKNFTTVNMDFIQHYRARENVLRRPVLSGGTSYAITGHHEIMFPLLAAAVMEETGK